MVPWRRSGRLRRSDQLDLSDRSHPKIGTRFNVPGQLVGASSEDPTILYTIDYRWDDNNNPRNDLDVVKISGGLAYLQSVTPIDGWVVYSGPYRTYGQLLILNAGGGYYMVLAGMDRINVSVGQFVLAGEPVAVMGDGSGRTAAAAAIGAAQPVLYIEVRKNETAIDPGPWWSKSNIEKARG